MSEKYPDTRLRPFLVGDIPAIKNIYDHYVHTSVATFDITPPSIQELSEKFGGMVKHQHPIISAENSGTLVGYAYASNYGTRHGYRFASENSIYLHPDFIGQGLGTRLLDQLITEASEFGFTQMVAIIASEMEASIRLHEKAGFTNLATFPKLGHKFGRWIDVSHLQLAL